MTIREKLYKIVFETDTKAGRNFDIFLLWIILSSVVLVMLDSVPSYHLQFKQIFISLEWILTIIFTLEYIIRIFISPKPIRYIFSFWGMVDLLSILPSFISLIVTGYHYLVIIRIFRLLRVFRVLKLARFTSETHVLMEALVASSYKISIFLTTVLTIVTFLGTIMYVVEGGEKGFTSIPQSIYWAIVTVTTVGYGDMVPNSVLGKFISSFAMIIGYAILAVPTGIVTMEMTKVSNKFKPCTNCNSKNDLNANYCSHCGTKFLE
ncbi:MAG: ion transporter [Leptospira sp.]|jgi:voltage-gated potassium channel|nr:ion transporter [Leptospira sp.]NCS92377.1 ion transporter [Leptospira sp.]